MITNQIEEKNQEPSDLLPFRMKPKAFEQPLSYQEILSTSNTTNEKGGALNEIIIDSTYRLGLKIGAGSFGKIHKAVNIHTNEEVAIKIESASSKSPQLSYEGRIYQHLHSGAKEPVQGIPRMIKYLSDGENNYLVIDLLGPSLEELFNSCGRQFSLKTVLMLAEQLLSRVEFLHSKELLHRDIKPDNFLMGVGENSTVVYAIDFGLAKKYMKNKKHIECIYGKKLTGTARYASINTHKGLEQSRRDDLESIGYILVYFLKGGLPWQGLKAKNKQERYDQIRDKKIETTIASLCEGLQPEFAEYLKIVKNLKFDEAPDYKLLRDLFKNVMEQKKYSYDWEFDWIATSKVTTLNVNGIKICLEKRETGYESRVIHEDKIIDQKKTLTPLKTSLPTKSYPKNGKNDEHRACLSIFGCFA